MYRTDAAPDRTLLICAVWGGVYALERSTGKLRWEAKVAGATVEILIDAGVVVVATSSHLAFIDYATGAVHASIVQQGTIDGRSTMVLDSGHIYVARQGEVACYTLRGESVWLQPFKGKGRSSVALGLPGNVRQGDF